MWLEHSFPTECVILWANDKNIKMVAHIHFLPKSEREKNYPFIAVSQLFHIIGSPSTTSVVWWSEFLATDPEVRIPFPALPDSLRNSGSGTGCTQPRENN
jgi:hypothetical protein